jgi:GT2 family glycosyltransferase
MLENITMAPDEGLATSSWLMLTNDQTSLTLDALQSYEAVGWPTPLLLLDNGKGGDSESVRERFAHRLGVDLQVFGDGTNYGVAGGRNYLAQRATCDWLVFVDNDVLFTEEVAGLVDELRRSSSDIVLPVILDRGGRVCSAGGTFRPWLSWGRNGYAGADVETARRHLDRYADWGGGCCLSVRRSTFEAVRGFDAARHGLYGAEDIDFCLRARKAGASSVRSASAPIVHLDAGAGADREQKYKALRKAEARLRAAHGVWITRYPSAWFWYLRRWPPLQRPKRVLWTCAARFGFVTRREGG